MVRSGSGRRRIRKVSRRSSHRAGHRIRRFHLPGVESLEERIVMSDVRWDGGGGNSDWNNPFNWDSDVLPGTTDDLFIDASAAGGAVITFSSGTASINSLHSGKSLAVSGGSLSIA